MKEYTNIGFVSPLSKKAAFLMKFTTTPGTYSAETCQSYTMAYGTNDEKNSAPVSFSSWSTSNSYITTLSAMTFSKFTTNTLTALGTTNLRRLGCAFSTGSVTLTNQNWDFGL